MRRALGGTLDVAAQQSRRELKKIVGGPSIELLSGLNICKPGSICIAIRCTADTCHCNQQCTSIFLTNILLVIRIAIYLNGRERRNGPQPSNFNVRIPMLGNQYSAKPKLNRIVFGQQKCPLYEEQPHWKEGQIP